MKRLRTLFVPLEETRLKQSLGLPTKKCLGGVDDEEKLTYTIVNSGQNREVLGMDFKIYGDIENPLFLAKDVANWIGHSNVSVMLNSADEEEKELIQIGTLNNGYSAWFLTEEGLYEVLMVSRKPIAKEGNKLK